MPPLRDRIEDLPELARLFLDRYKSKFRKPVKGVADSALKILASYWWPGNIRELENLIERLVAVHRKGRGTHHDPPPPGHSPPTEGGGPPRDTFPFSPPPPDPAHTPATTTSTPLTTPQ